MASKPVFGPWRSGLGFSTPEREKKVAKRKPAPQRKPARTVFSNPLSSPVRTVQGRGVEKYKPAPKRQLKFTGGTTEPLYTRITPQFRATYKFLQSPEGRRIIARSLRSASPEARFDAYRYAAANPYRPGSDAILRTAWNEIPRQVEGKYTLSRGARAVMEFDSFTPTHKSVWEHAVDASRSAAEKAYDTAVEGTSHLPGILGESARREQRGLPYAAITGPQAGASPGFSKNLVKDAASFYPQVGLAAYQVGKDIVDETKKTGNPFQGVGYALKKDVYEPIKHTVTNPVESFNEAPVTTAFILKGAAQVPGRAAGMTMRSGVLGARAQEIGSRGRAFIEVDPTTGQLVRRRYSPDVFVKAAQVYRDKRMTEPVKQDEVRRSAKTGNEVQADRVVRLRTPAQEGLTPREAWRGMSLAAERSYLNSTNVGARVRRADQRANANDAMKREERAIAQTSLKRMFGRDITEGYRVTLGPEARIDSPVVGKVRIAAGKETLPANSRIVGGKAYLPDGSIVYGITDFKAPRKLRLARQTGANFATRSLSHLTKKEERNLVGHLADRGVITRDGDHVAELTQELRRLDDASMKLDGSELESNRVAAQAIREARDKAKKGNLDVSFVFDAARRYRGLRNVEEARAVDAGILTRETAERRRVLPAAELRGVAEFDKGGMLSDRALRARAAQAEAKALANDLADSRENLKKEKKKVRKRASTVFANIRVRGARLEEKAKAADRADLAEARGGQYGDLSRVERIQRELQKAREEYQYALGKTIQVEGVRGRRLIKQIRLSAEKLKDSKNPAEREYASEVLWALRQEGIIKSELPPVEWPSIAERNRSVKEWEAKYGMSWDDILTGKPIDISPEALREAQRLAREDMDREQATPARDATDPRTMSSTEPPGWTRINRRSLTELVGEAAGRRALGEQRGGKERLPSGRTVQVNPRVAYLRDKLADLQGTRLTEDLLAKQSRVIGLTADLKVAKREARSAQREGRKAAIKNVKAGFPADRPSVKAVAKDLSARDVAVEAFDEAASRKAVKRRLRKEGAVLSDVEKHIEAVPTSELARMTEIDRKVTPQSSRQYEALRRDIEKNGIREPVVIDYNPDTGRAYISEGNTRVAIAQELGIKDIPAYVYRSRRTPKGVETRRVELRPDEAWANPREKSGFWVPQYFKPSQISLPAKRWREISPEDVGSSRSTRPETPAEMLRRAAVLRDERYPRSDREADIAQDVGARTTRATMERNEGLAAAERMLGGIVRDTQAILKDVRREAKRTKRYRNERMPKRFVEGGKKGTNAVEIATKDIEKRLRELGVDVDSLAFVPHRAGDVRKGDYYKRDSENRTETLMGDFYTGSSLRRGVYDASLLGMEARMVSQALSRAVMNSMADMIREIGVPAKNNKGELRLFTVDAAERRIDQVKKNGGPDLVAVRAFRASDRTATQKLLNDIENAKEGIALDDVFSQVLGIKIDRATAKSKPGGTVHIEGLDLKDADVRKALGQTPNIYLVDGDAMGRILQHADLHVPFSWIGAAFRRTVLPFSPRWIGGNLAEAILRSGIAGVNPLHAKAYANVLTKMALRDEQWANSYRYNTEGGLMVGSQINMAVKTDRTLMIERDRWKNAVRQAVVKPSDAMFRMNKAMEDAFQRAVAGKHAVGVLTDFNNSWFKAVKAQGKAVEGMLDSFDKNPAKAYAFLDDAARYTNDTLGKYNQFSPIMRMFIQGYAPFMAWYLNSLRLFAYTLPVKHPVLTAMIAASTKAIDEDLKAQAKKAPSAALRAGIPLEGNQVLDIARITPLGVAAEPASILAKEFVPQIVNARDILFGQNPVNPKIPLTDENGKEIDSQLMRFFLAANAFMEGVVPYVSQIRRYMTPGSTQAPNSTLPSALFRLAQGKSRDEAFHVRKTVQKKNPFMQFASPIPVVKYGGKGGGRSKDPMTAYKKLLSGGSTGKSSGMDEYKRILNGN